MLIAPVEMHGTEQTLPCPRRMIDPLPNCFSIWPTAISTAFVRSCFCGFRGHRAVRSVVAELLGSGVG